MAPVVSTHAQLVFGRTGAKFRGYDILDFCLRFRDRTTRAILAEEAHGQTFPLRVFEKTVLSMSQSSLKLIACCVGHYRGTYDTKTEARRSEITHGASL